MAWIAGLLTLAAAAASQYNTQQVAKRQDNQLAVSLVNQGNKQKQIDSKVNDQVTQLQASTADASRRSLLQNYMTTLQRGKAATNAGLAPNIGGSAFQSGSAKAAGDIQDYAANSADLMSQMDAPSRQRQTEAFGYGHLGTDVGLLAREAQGQSYLDDLRLRSIKRNPWIDAAAAGASGYAGAKAGGGSSGSGSYTGNSTGPGSYGGFGNNISNFRSGGP
jgi:hypothetical protein